MIYSSCRFNVVLTCNHWKNLKSNDTHCPIDNYNVLYWRPSLNYLGLSSEIVGHTVLKVRHIKVPAWLWYNMHNFPSIYTPCGAQMSHIDMQFLDLQLGNNSSICRMHDFTRKKNPLHWAQRNFFTLGVGGISPPSYKINVRRLLSTIDHT